MEYGPQILERVVKLSEDSGATKAGLQGLRDEFERSRSESSDRHKMLCDKLEELAQEQRALSESSDARHVDVGELRKLVERCPQHHPDGAGIDVPESRLRKPDDSGSMRRARRGVLKSLAALFTAAATALAGWWASRK